MQLKHNKYILSKLDIRRKSFWKKRKFEEINLSNEIQKGVAAMGGFEEMSPIQSQAIPVIVEGKDIIGQAQTGTGKTAAFGIPILEMVQSEDKTVQALVLCPTRELSIQVAEEIGNIGKYKKRNTSITSLWWSTY